MALHFIIVAILLGTYFVTLKPASAAVPIYGFSDNTFFRFGANNLDALLPADDDGFAFVHLKYNFKYFNQTYSQLFVNINGAISFNQGVSTYTPNCNPQPIPMINAFWADVDITYGGQVSYRETIDSTDLAQANAQIVQAFPAFEGISLGWAFIATWYEVPFYEELGSCASQGAPNFRNTFQAILTTDGVHSFVIFYYNTITWTTGIASGGNCSGVGGIPAKVGFDVGNGFFNSTPGSCTADIINIEDQSNIGAAGKFVFRVDEQFVPGAGVCGVPNPNPYNKIQVSPSFTSILGHVSLKLQGMCLNDVTSATCQFWDYGTGSQKYVPAVVSPSPSPPNTLECITPYNEVSWHNGLVVTVVIGDDDPPNTQLYFGSFYSVSPLPEFFLGNAEGLAGSSGIVNLDMYWDPYPFGSGALLDLVLVEYINQQWVEQKLVISGINTTGHFSGTGDIGTPNVTGVHVFRLTGVHPVTLNTLETGAAHKPSAFSELLYFGSTDPATNVAACLDWFNADTGPPTGTLPCPPTLNQLQHDNQFTLDWSVIFNLALYNPNAAWVAVQRIAIGFPFAPGAQCAYDIDGNIMLGMAGGGSTDFSSPNDYFGFVNHWLYDTRPWKQCCQYANDTQSCLNYFQKRPSDPGTDYTGPSASMAGGDPHFVTFDGLAYTFNAVGEFWMAKSDNFSMQARMIQYIMANSTAAPASVFSSFAFRQAPYGNFDESRIQIDVQAGGFYIYLNNELTNINVGQTLPTTIFPNGTALTLETPTRLVLLFASGFGFTVTTADDNKSLNVIGQAQKAQYGKVTGLFGYFDGTSSNDLKASDGTTIPSTSSGQTINDDFGQSWRITEAESLFRYVAGRTYSSYQNAAFVPQYGIPDVSQFPADVVSMCGGSQACLYDYAVTGSRSLANDTKTMEASYTEKVSSLAVVVPMCSPLENPSNGYYQARNFMVGSKAIFTCNPGYKINGKKQITCVNSANPHWNHSPPTCQQ